MVKEPPRSRYCNVEPQNSFLVRRAERLRASRVHSSALALALASEPHLVLSWPVVTPATRQGLWHPVADTAVVSKLMGMHRLRS